MALVAYNTIIPQMLRYIFYCYFAALPFANNLIWDKVFNSRLSKFCGSQPLKDHVT